MGGDLSFLELLLRAMDKRGYNITKMMADSARTIQDLPLPTEIIDYPVEGEISKENYHMTAYTVYPKGTTPPKAGTCPIDLIISQIVKISVPNKPPVVAVYVPSEGKARFYDYGVSNFGEEASEDINSVVARLALVPLQQQNM